MPFVIKACIATQGQCGKDFLVTDERLKSGVITIDPSLAGNGRAVSILAAKAHETTDNTVAIGIFAKMLSHAGLAIPGMLACIDTDENASPVTIGMRLRCCQQ